MEKSPRTRLSTVQIFRKILVAFTINFSLVFMAVCFKYLYFLEESIRWKDVWMSAFLFGVAVTLIWNFSDIKILVMRIRQSEL